MDYLYISLMCFWQHLEDTCSLSVNVVDSHIVFGER